MKKIEFLLICVTGLFLSSCATTGDPSAGGFFMWSPKKADERISEREMVLEQVRSNRNSY
jgi:hypothetical protein